ncbi:anti-sigma factor [Spirosoma sp. KUDC1026]|uniref:anti-sigma factor n=1 Tax=Spirosoma sp. KUDC1026 TaxID=2745947 RepID=UPI00159BCFD4|nr:anti-sigma factor [Spirosoma sp. KUDC1026]QKZ11699.1 hypothetical protein HU175_03285 [Spirosoma sp. KUDC1026]
MNESDKNPDEFWRSIFNDAAETPPPRVWDAIERRLDEPDEAVIVPLWSTGIFSKRPVSWGMGVAATVALLLAGWWVSQPAENNQPVAAHQKKLFMPESHQQDAVAQNQAYRRSSSRSLSVGPGEQRESNETGNADVTSALSPTETSTLSGRQLKAIHPGQATNRLAQQTRPASAHARAFDGVSLQKLPDRQSSSQIAMTLPTEPAVAQSFAARTSPEAPVMAQNQSAFQIQKIDTRPMKLRSAGPIRRIVWVRPYEAPQEPLLAKSKRASREHWVSLNVMPSSFNPAVSVQASQPALASAYGFRIASASQPPVKNQADLSVAYQASAGLQLNDHWSVESGVGYLAGHATVDSPSQPYPASMLSLGGTTMPVNTLYTEVLRQSVQRNTVAAADMANNWAASSTYNSLYAYDPQTRQTLTNDYQFVQVPVQVGYQLRPRKRLGLALLGGVLTNIFLRNTVENQLVVKPEDGIYQPVTLAAAMGARFQYRSSQRWSASLAGMYQPTLGSATKSGSNVQSHPTTTGMSFGVDYHF